MEDFSLWRRKLGPRERSAPAHGLAADQWPPLAESPCGLRLRFHGCQTDPTELSSVPLIGKWCCPHSLPFTPEGTDLWGPKGDLAKGPSASVHSAPSPPSPCPPLPLRVYSVRAPGFSLRHRPQGWVGIPGMSDGRHPLITVLRVLCPQLQGFLALMAEVDREVVLHREEDASSYRGIRGACRGCGFCSSRFAEPRWLGTGAVSVLVGMAFCLAVSSLRLRQALCHVTEPMFRILLEGSKPTALLANKLQTTASFKPSGMLEGGQGSRPEGVPFGNCVPVQISTHVIRFTKTD